MADKYDVAQEQEGEALRGFTNRVLRDLRALERSFSTGGGGQVLIPHVIIDAERTVGNGVSRSLVRGIRPAIRRPKNVAEARIERAR